MNTGLYTANESKRFPLGIDSAVMEERRKGRHELGEAHSLLEVARREQSKTALQLQQAERRVGNTRL